MGRSVSRVLPVVLVLALVCTFSGGALLYAGVSCSTSMTWSLEVGVVDTETMENGTVVVQGQILLTGSTGEPHLWDVSIIFLAADGTSLRSLAVGDITHDAQHERNFTVTLPEQPIRIEPHPRHIDAHEDTKWFLVGLEWTGIQYDEVVLETNPEPWYC